VVLLPVVPGAVNADSHKAGLRFAALVADNDPTAGLSASGEWTPGATPNSPSVSVGSPLDAKDAHVLPHKRLHWSLVGDFGARFIGNDSAGTEVTFMVGPRYSVYRTKVLGETKHTFFFQGLAGASVADEVVDEKLKSTTHTSLAPGVGWDILIHPGANTAFRVQVERVFILKSDRPDYTRFSVGVVYRFLND
jgi:hypothetical protein